MHAEMDQLIKLTDQLVEAFDQEEWDLVLSIQTKRSALLETIKASISSSELALAETEELRNVLSLLQIKEKTCLSTARTKQKALVASQQKNQKGKQMKKAYGSL